MSATPRLLTKTSVSIANVSRRNFHITLLRRQRKIFHMTRQPFCGSISIGEATFSTQIDSTKSMASPSTQREFNKSIMEPYLDSYAANNTTPNCDVAFNLPINDIMDQDSCPNDIYNVDANLCINSSRTVEEKRIIDRENYKAMRRWKRFRSARGNVDQEDYFVLRLLSFNILAQNLLEAYPYLYKAHDKQALPWETRKTLLLQEILEAKANIICLQEMQVEHLSEFLIPFKELGYKHVYKKRTNDKRDGLLFLYRSDQFILVDHIKVELYQSGIELLSRDNVGIIAKLALKDDPKTQFIIATTHLLYNPRRNDVRLGQTQLLLAEIERIAFIENAVTGPKYLPIILSGDFNLEPYTGVYRFITEGSFEYYGKDRTLERAEYRSLTNSLVPPRLCVTDNCQHFNVLTKRLRGNGSGKIMLENSESGDEKCTNIETRGGYSVEIDTQSNDFQSVEITQGHRVNFSSGMLTHPFNMYSVYRHVNKHGEREATTNQGKWITVDYIFYSDVEPIEKYMLPTVADCSILRAIPNFAVGSDHLCLGATFKITRKK